MADIDTISNNSDVPTEDNDNEADGYLIHQAVEHDNASLLECLLQGDEKQNINCFDTRDQTALYRAVAEQKVECCHLLLEAGADVNAQCGPDAKCQTALHRAARDGNATLVSLLLDRGARWFMYDSEQRTAMQLAQSTEAHDSLLIINSVAKDKEHQLLSACKNADVHKAKRLIPELPKETVARILNMRVGDYSTSFLHNACEEGDTDMTSLILAHNAGDAGVHPVTGMSPLHAACKAGNVPCVQLLLKKFPELIQAPTIDCLLPLHEACFEGHLDIVKVLLNFPYPEPIIKTFKEQNGCRMYRLGFDIKVKDGHGRSPLHLACMRNRPQIVRELLEFKTPVTSKYNEGSFRVKHSQHKHLIRESRKRLSRSEGGVRMFEEAHESVTEACVDEGVSGEEVIHPVKADIDAIDLDGNTALHVAVKNKGNGSSLQIAELLLKYGANANKPIISSSGNQSPLTLACNTEDVDIVNALLKYGAKDPDNKVLVQAIASQNEEMIGVFLKQKNHLDATYRINLPKLHEVFRMSNPGGMSVSWCNSSVHSRHVWPKNPVVIDWRGLSLLSLDISWLVGACMLHNKRKNHLDASMPVEELALFAITRIDISDNELTKLPFELSKLPSLRSLNAANNQIDWIPGCPIPVPRSCSCLAGILRSPSNVTSSPPCSPTCVHKTANQETEQALDNSWDSPLLEEVNLQSNKLTFIPKGLCRLSSLKKLNLAFNKIETVPDEIWLNQSLSELNLSHNKVKQLCDTDIEAMPAYMNEITISGSPQKDPAILNTDVTNQGLVQVKLPGYQAGFQKIAVHHMSRWMEQIKVRDSSDPVGKSAKNSKFSNTCRLMELNISHNALTKIPEGLPCLAPQLETLNLSHNKLTHLGIPRMYPASLRELDVSHNALRAMIREDLEGSGESAPHVVQVCCSPYAKSTRSIARSASQACRHRSHTCFERLRVLKMSRNKLTRLCFKSGSDYREMATLSPSPKKKIGNQQHLYFPNLSILDAGHNELTTITADLALHTQLSECKLQHNSALAELPPDLGLLRKLWNLDIQGCRVYDHLQAWLGDKAKRTANVLGYLKSVKEEAVPYNRMKLMFVGIQGIGKTSLLTALRKQGKTSTETSKTWSQRMGHSTGQGRDLKGENISTVGVDIGDLSFEKDGVVFSTWDFGGQREYYATHQYFLSKRSLYLVVWNLQDGEKGVNQIMQWLVNIQARAPNSPVIIVGTHLDMIRKPHYAPNYIDDLRESIRKKYIAQQEPEKSGLPRVLDQIEVCTRNRFLQRNYIAELRSLILRAVRRASNEKGVTLLSQKVPAIYVHLEDVVRHLAADRKLQYKDPVLHANEYRLLVLNAMEARYSSTFRDMSELNQATQFLHENGVLLHYDDTSLQNAYFLDPQWLCDILANVVTIREINGLARAGIMKTEDLKMLFKNAAFKPDDIKAYVINLLSKFEVALLWDETNLLIPSMLPSEDELRRGHSSMQVRIPVKGSPRRNDTPAAPVIHSSLQLNDSTRPSTHSDGLNTLSHMLSNTPEQTGVAHRGSPSHHVISRHSNVITSPFGMSTGSETVTDSGLGYSSSIPSDNPPSLNDSLDAAQSNNNDNKPLITCITNPASCIVRLYLMSYFPSGFWPRFITRLLGDASFYQTALSIYELPELLKADDTFMASEEACPMWRCWQTGVRLDYLGACLLRVKEVTGEDTSAFCDYRQCKVHVKQADMSIIDLRDKSILEILIPNEALSVMFETMSLTMSMTDSMCPPTVVIHPDQKTVASLLNKVVDHIDTLLEDWYPDLGARFMQNSKGMYLITRLVPCIRCLVIQTEIQNKRLESDHAWSLVDTSPIDKSPTITSPVLIEPTSRHSYADSDSSQPRISSSQSTGALDSEQKRMRRKGMLFQDGNAVAIDANSGDQLTVPAARPRSEVEDISHSAPKNEDKRSEMPAHGEVQMRRRPKTVDSAPYRWNGFFPYYAGAFTSYLTQSHKYKENVPEQNCNQDDQNQSARNLAPNDVNNAQGQGQNSNQNGYQKMAGDGTSGQDQDCETDKDANVVHCYLIEQCFQAAQSGKVVYCPKHGSLGPYFIASSTGEITEGHIAPDSVFQDMAEDYLIDPDLITRGRFLGRGAFGAVYAGTLVNKETEEEEDIAMKMMQPVKPTSDAPQSLCKQYEQEKKKWSNEPMKYACEAYLNVRKELSILLSLQHDHIVSLLGVSTQPLCLVLSLAPQGALNDRLEEYHRKGVKLPVYAVHLIIQQVASALAYLHKNLIIYRDIKSENVLVWRLEMPDDELESDSETIDSFEDACAVDVKLADYGVSRSVLPCGTKGLAGTPLFMAPEIVRHSGEETYTEKVDIYSFGMFIYELLTQKSPFDGDVMSQDLGRFNRDSYIVNGGRPAISEQECIYPTYFLDLLSRCWANEPERRPSANQIVSLTEWAEFTQLCGSQSLPEFHKVMAAAAVPHTMPPMLQYSIEELDRQIAEEEEEVQLEDRCDVWLSLAPDMAADVPNAIAIYTYSKLGCEGAKQRTLPTQCEITLMCATSEHMWCADSRAHIRIFSLSSLEEVAHFPATTRSRPGHPVVQSMVYGPASHKMYLVINTGQNSRFVVCRAEIPDPGNSPVTMDCPGNGKIIHTVALVNNKQSEELWCGHQRGGEISIWNLSSDQRVRTVAHDQARALQTVYLVVTDSMNTAVWTYVYPGTEVYRWDIYTRQVTHVVDLAHVIPSRPSPLLAKHVANDFLIASKCQVVSMCVHTDQVYVGSTLGCISVFHKHTLMPCSVVQCNADEEAVRFLIPLVFTTPHLPEPDTISNSSASESIQDQSDAHILSISQGHLDVTSHVLPSYDVARSQRSRHYLSTWRAKGWQTSAKVVFKSGNNVPDTIDE